MNLFRKTFSYKKEQWCRFICMLFLACLFLSCKRSNNQQLHRKFDPVLVQTLNKLKQKYSDKKVRVNTWNKKAGAYLDIAVLDASEQPTKQLLTIGDSVQFVGINFNHAIGILAKIKYKTGLNGYIPYNNVEEFEPATALDSDLKD